MNKNADVALAQGKPVKYSEFYSEGEMQRMLAETQLKFPSARLGRDKKTQMWVIYPE